MAKATIKTKSGALITIEGSEGEISGILNVFEKATAVGHVKETFDKKKVAVKEEKKRSSASDLIVDLKEEGFFEKTKTLNDISTALEETGFLYPVTTL